MNDLHVLPTNDLYVHEEDELCKCNPEIIRVLGTRMIVHHSFDGREKDIINSLKLRLTKQQLN